MSQLFSDYEREYNELSQKISKRITVIAGQSGEAKKQSLRAAENDMEDANRVIQQMDLELRSLAPAQRSKLTPRLRNYQSDHSQLRKDLRRVAQQQSSANARASLMDGYNADNRDLEAAQMDQRSRLLANYDRLQATNDRLANTHRVAQESNDIGTSVLQDLHEQRDVIVRARDNLEEADENMSRSRRLIQSMSRRVVTNRLILALIILILMGTIGTIVYFKFIAPKVSSGSGGKKKGGGGGGGGGKKKLLEWVLE